MIEEIKGDLLTSGTDILCHQTNYVGVMGAGIAYAIKTKLLTPEQYVEYQRYCQLYGAVALGSVQFIHLSNGQYVANVFSQDDFYSKRKDTITDYSAMEISTHTSLAGRDTTSLSSSWQPTSFLLTRPSRDVTTL